MIDGEELQVLECGGELVIRLHNMIPA